MPKGAKKAPAKRKQVAEAPSEPLPALEEALVTEPVELGDDSADESTLEPTTKDDFYAVPTRVSGALLSVIRAGSMTKFMMHCGRVMLYVSEKVALNGAKQHVAYCTQCRRIETILLQREEAKKQAPPKKDPPPLPSVTVEIKAPSEPDLADVEMQASDPAAVDAFEDALPEPSPCQAEPDSANCIGNKVYPDKKKGLFSRMLGG